MKIILHGIGAALALYLMACFVMWEFPSDMGEWEDGSRAMFLYFAVVAVVASAIWSAVR